MGLRVNGEVLSYLARTIFTEKWEGRIAQEPAISDQTQCSAHNNQPAQTVEIR
jgi:hypothetical protein